MNRIEIPAYYTTESDRALFVQITKCFQSDSGPTQGHIGRVYVAARVAEGMNERYATAQFYAVCEVAYNRLDTSDSGWVEAERRMGC